MRALFSVALGLMLVSLRARAETGRFPDPPAAQPQRPTPSRVPKGSEALIERAERQEREGRPESAAAAYTEALQLEPSNVRALMALGKLRARMNDSREAEAVFSTATGFSEVAAEAFRERAVLRKSAGRDDEAMTDLATAVALAPEETAWAEELARWYVARRAWLPALAIHRKLALEFRGSAREKQAALEVRALRILSGDLDPVMRGRSSEHPFIRRALARLADR